MILRLLNPQGIAGLAASICLALLLLLQKAETHHWKKQSAQFEQLYHAGQAAFAQTIAGYRAAADAARTADRAAADRVRAEQAAINERTANDYETRLAAVRARADELRRDAQASADSGGRGTASVPALSPAASGSHEAAIESRLSGPDALIATEQAIQLDELIKWNRRQHSVDPNADKPRRPIVRRELVRPLSVTSHIPGRRTRMSGFEDIREHMKVIGADGAPIGTVDRVEDNRIKLIRADSGIGHEAHHHFIPRGLVAEVEGDTVRLTARGDVVADLFEQEKSGQPIG